MKRAAKKLAKHKVNLTWKKYKNPYFVIIII